VPERSADAERGVLLGALAALNSLSRNPSLDRLIRGRVWIVLIAFALLGIVTLQLLVLRLNANIGRALVREAQLQRANAALSIESSELAAGERVESLTAKLGMELVPEGALRFLSINPRADIARAAATLDKPVQTASTGSAEAGGASTAGSTSEAGEKTSAVAEAPAATSTSAVVSATGQGGEASTATSEAAATSESPATGSSPSAATQPTGPETGSTGAVGTTGATEASSGAGANGAQAGGAG
jgi:cell division protein FtsL